ncbi:hypothetical protein LZ31DRAFT_611374 [Colletotrichum somersetense]|nr:hypothetical protein LZ31DRAFT_611374 [Colletotrichum somersetense]
MLAPSPPPSPPPTLAPNAVAFMRLPSPVIIPQRRIMNRSRGFVSNYSSSLRDAGIDEKAFSTFINQLNRLAELKPRAQAIDFSGFAHLCSNTDQDVFMSMAVGMAFETAKGIQHSTAMNKLIDKTNNELFRPKGLICLLMTWKPEGPTSSTLDRAIRSRPVHLVKNERIGRAKRSKAKLSPFQGMGMFEWSQPTSIKRIDGDAKVLPVTGIPTECNQYPMQNDDKESIHNRTSQLLAVNHLEDRHGPQVATVEIGVRAHSQDGIPFQLAETAGLKSLKSHSQITLSNLGGCSTPEEKDISDCGPSSIWNPAPVMSIGEVNEGQTKDPYSRKEFKGLDFFNSSLPPSFTTGALKALETETLYVLIANMPDDEEARRDTICE